MDRARPFGQRGPPVRAGPRRSRSIGPSPVPSTGRARGLLGLQPSNEIPPGGVNELGPIARTGTLIADSIIASSYTPGAGNVF